MPLNDMLRTIWIVELVSPSIIMTLVHPYHGPTERRRKPTLVKAREYVFTNNTRALQQWKQAQVVERHIVVRYKYIGRMLM